MPKVLLLGAGYVTSPLIDYLLAEGHELTVADRMLDVAREKIAGWENGHAVELDIIGDPSALDAHIAAADIVLSMLPFRFHVRVAKLCIANKKNMVTSSYVSPEMRALDGAAREAGVLILNEIGVDPGIDHMSAMRVIDKVQGDGGRIKSFRSSTGGLPAPAAKDTPWGYKFSWSPRGVLMASRNAAKWLEGGALVEVPGDDLFLHHWPLEVEGVGALECYPNRDAMRYVGLYGLEGVETMFRGTLRYPGWCVAMKQLVDLGWLDLEPRDDLPGRTYGEVTWELLGGSPSGDLRTAVAETLGVPASHDSLDRMEFAGLFGDAEISALGTTCLDALRWLLEPLLAYQEGQVDMIAMVHEFVAVYEGGAEQTITSTLVDFGIPGGDSSMSRTVSLPAAIAAQMILEGEIQVTGVHVPVIPAIYEPVLHELESMDIKLVENWGD